MGIGLRVWRTGMASGLLGAWLSAAELPVEPYVDPAQFGVPWPKHSHYRQPWRAFLETRSGDGGWHRGLRHRDLERTQFRLPASWARTASTRTTTRRGCRLAPTSSTWAGTPGRSGGLPPGLSARRLYDPLLDREVPIGGTPSGTGGLTLEVPVPDTPRLLVIGR